MQTRFLTEADALRPGCSEGALSGLQEALGRALPEDYLDFLRRTDGYNGYIPHDDGGSKYVRMHGAEHVRRNTSDCDQYHEEDSTQFGCVEVGDEGAGWRFVLLSDDTYARVDPGTDDEPVRLAGTFTGLLEALAGEPR